MVLDVRGVVGLDLEHFAALLAPEVIVLRVLADVVYLEVRLGARLEVAQGAGVQLRWLVVDLHVPGKIRTGLEALTADRALVRPRVAVLEHVTSELALAIEADIADLAEMLFLLHVAARPRPPRELVLVSFPKVQRRVVQVFEILAHRLAPFPGLSLEDATVLFLFLTRVLRRLGFLVGTIIFRRDGRRLLDESIKIVSQFYYQKIRRSGVWLVAPKKIIKIVSRFDCDIVVKVLRLYRLH